MSNYNSDYDFYEKVARDNKVNDTPEQAKYNRSIWLPSTEPPSFSREKLSAQDKLQLLRYHLIDTVLKLRDHESGRPIMSDFALIHNLHVGLGSLVDMIDDS